MKNARTHLLFTNPHPPSSNPPSTIYQPLATKRSVKLLLSVLSIFSFFIVFIAASAPATAANGADFQAGRIIDDVVFTNNQSMSVGQIQAFLDAKVPVCDRWRPSSNPNYQPPWTCLKEYQENPTTGDNNISNVGRGPNGEPRQVPGGISAAQIIWNAAQAHNISPQVILVTLQKEQSLVTDDWPWSIQYFRAMGANCPDGPGGAQCNPAYAGFLKQVDGGTWQFRHDFNGIGTPGFWAPYARGWNNILYQDPNTTGGCGTKQVFIENQATAVLYKYTPYTPNQAALNNLYGTGDACSAYGNRNFWRLFTDWFGSTYAANFTAQYYGQSSLPTLKQGESKTIYFDYKNVGNVAWLDESTAGNNWAVVPPVRLATSTPLNRISPFSLSWPSKNRATGMFSKVFEADGVTLAGNQHVAFAGQIARFEFTITAANTQPPGIYREWFQPVLEGSTLWYMNGLAWTDVTVTASETSANYVGQSHSTISMQSDEKRSAFFKYRNAGNVAWYDSSSSAGFFAPIHLATSNNINRASVFGTNWAGIKNRPNLNFSQVFEADGTTLSSNQDVVLPGQVAKIDFTYNVPFNTPPGTYREWFQLVREGPSGWDVAGSLAWMEVVVLPTTTSSSYIGQSATPSVARGANVAAFFKYRNAGNVAWYDSSSSAGFFAPIHLATSNNINRASVFGTNWAGIKNRPNLNFSQVFEADGTTLSSNQDVVLPGQVAKIDFTYNVPFNTPPGTYREWFQLVREGSSGWDVAGSLAWMEVVVL